MLLFLKNNDNFKLIKNLNNNKNLSKRLAKDLEYTKQHVSKKKKKKVKIIQKKFETQGGVSDYFEH